MRTSPVGILTIAIVIAFSIALPAYAQEDKDPAGKPISAGDSLSLRRYIDSVNAAPLYTQKCQRYLDSVLAIEPWKVSWWQQKAMPLYKQKKYEAGSAYLDSAVKYDTKKYIDYRAFMECIFQKSYKLAIKDFVAAKEIIGDGDVMDHTYDFYIGLCYLQLDLFDSAQ